MTSSLFARTLWIALLALSVWETSKSFALTQSRINQADIQAMQRSLRQVQRPILAHRAWLEPSLRSWFPASAQPSVFANPAPHELEEFWSIGHRSDPEGLTHAPNAQLQTTITHGALVARQWVQPRVPITVASLGPNAMALTNLHARVDQGPCKIISKSPLEIQCPDQSSLTWEIGEINYKARSCLAYRTSQLGPLTLSFKLAKPNAPQRLVGHVGFSDFNARLRSDAALQVSVHAGTDQLFDRPFSDAQGWTPFAAPLLELADPSPTYHITLLLNATHAKSKNLHRRVIPCIELRFQRHGAEEAQ